MFCYRIVILYVLVAYTAEESLKDFQGELVEVGELPYVVSIVTEGVSVCTGAIVAENWVLSAAHCFASDGDVISASEVKVSEPITQ